jgi:single-stranded-DNA-specific exonuclease
MKKIIVRRPLTAAHRLPASLHPVLRRVYAARAVRDAEELSCSAQHLLPYSQMGGVAAAVDLLAAAIIGQRRILVVADFDADGATSCAVAVRALRAMGARQVGYLVPNRFEFGYGLTPEIVAVAAEQSPDLLVTVDNGISSIEGVRAARASGMQVLITDHHLPGPVLPEAHAIVNPNLPGDRFPSKCLAGVGVIFYVLLALRAHLRGRGVFAPGAEPNMAQWLDLVALGTVADVVPLDRNNRILVEQGLRRIRAGLCSPGIRALMERAGRVCERACTGDLGYAVAPRLNAAGRLEDMAVGIECLLSDDLDEARLLADRLDALNRERRAIEGEMHEQAMAHLARLELAAGGDLPAALCLFDEAWHQGLIGIIASRIKEQVHRPVIAFAPAGNELKGSARSLSGVHIRDALDALTKRHPGLVTRFGGHAMAAGLALPRAHFETFRRAFDEEVRRSVDPDALSGVIHTDGELAHGDIGLELAMLLRGGGPWGQGFPEPLFDGEFELARATVVGERHLRLMLRPAGGGAAFAGIAFNTPERVLNGAERLRIAYRLDINEYRGLLSPQLVVEHLEPA